MTDPEEHKTTEEMDAAAMGFMEEALAQQQVQPAPTQAPTQAPAQGAPQELYDPALSVNQVETYDLSPAGQRLFLRIGIAAALILVTLALIAIVSG